uniref:UvrD/REP helicase n=1 Tax=Mimivirus LCMiAC02 TaxID=2506609 RepID=A0A4D5XF06_9VIRU|nr:MAG: UvrD/REP helicase [Mimivirus LCMiAC02]
MNKINKIYLKKQIKKFQYSKIILENEEILKKMTLLVQDKKPKSYTPIDFSRCIEYLSANINNIDYNKLNIKTKTVKTKLYDVNATHNINNEFLQKLFVTQLKLNNSAKIDKWDFIERILEKQYILVDDILFDKYITYIKKTGITDWTIYNKYKNKIRYDIRDLIDTKFNKKILLKSNIVVNKYFMEYFTVNMNKIQDAYTKYLAGKNYKDIITDIFYLTSIEYAYKSNNINKDHYKLNQLYEKMNEYSKTINYKNVMTNVHVKHCNIDIVGTIDMIINDTIVIITNTKYEYMRLFMYGLCRNKHTKYIIYDFVKGYKYDIEIRFNKNKYFKLLDILAESSKLKLNNINIIYDLEATGFISKKNMPKILQICMKDYNTNSIFYNRYVNINTNIPKRIQELTRITYSDIATEPTIDQTRILFKRIFKNINSVMLLAHNGNRYDHKLIKFYELIPLHVKIKYMDSLQLIKRCNVKFDNYKMNTIYKTLFGCDINNAHNAIGDVNALIDILRILHIF